MGGYVKDMYRLTRWLPRWLSVVERLHVKKVPLDQVAAAVVICIVSQLSITSGKQ